MSTDLIHRATLEELLGWRDRAIALQGEIFDIHAEMQSKLAAARKDHAVAISRACAGVATIGGDKWGELDQPREKYDRASRAGLDRAMWRALLKVTGMEALMDEQARKEFEQQLKSDPPEITADTVRATFRQFKADAHTIFRRGLVNVFRDFDRTYRSHDGFKIGNRVVRSYALSESGSIYDSRAALLDIDRIMHVLDGERIGEGWGSSLFAALDGATRSRSFSIQPGEVRTEYWLARWFKNRNLHLYPLRKDLLRRANRLIAEHFEDQLGAGPDAAGARRYTRARPHHHDVEDFYPTSPAVAEQMVKAANLRPGMDVLEPSAGEGAIVSAILAVGITPDAVENHPDRAETLRDMLPPGAVIEMDFLRMHPEAEFDAVLMNPPWGKGSGVQHVHHALRFLKPGGRLVALLGAGLTYREDGPTAELRRLIAAWGGRVTPLPVGSFKEAGTMTDAVMLVLDKPGLAALAAPVEAEREGLLV